MSGITWPDPIADGLPVPTVRSIMVVVSRGMCVPVAEITGPSHRRRGFAARQMIAAIAIYVSGLEASRVAGVLHRDPSTVLASAAAHVQAMHTDMVLCADTLSMARSAIRFEAVRRRGSDDDAEADAIGFDVPVAASAKPAERLRAALRAAAERGARTPRLRLLAEIAGFSSPASAWRAMQRLAAGGSFALRDKPSLRALPAVAFPDGVSTIPGLPPRQTYAADVPSLIARARASDADRLG